MVLDILGIIGLVLMITGHFRNVDGSARLMFGYRLLAFYFLVLCMIQYHTYYTNTEVTYPWFAIVHGVLFLFYAVFEYNARIIFKLLYKKEFEKEEK